MHFSNPLTHINTFMQFLIMHATQKNSNPCMLTGFLPITNFLMKKCNYLEVSLKNRGYNKMFARQQILKARKYKFFSKIYLLLTVFENIPIMGFKKEESFKNILVITKVYPLKIEHNFSGPCNKPRYEICENQNTSVWIIIYEAHLFHQTTKFALRF